MDGLTQSIEKIQKQLQLWKKQNLITKKEVEETVKALRSICEVLYQYEKLDPPYDILEDMLYLLEEKSYRFENILYAKIALLPFIALFFDIKEILQKLINEVSGLDYKEKEELLLILITNILKVKDLETWQFVLAEIKKIGDSLFVKLALFSLLNLSFTLKESFSNLLDNVERQKSHIALLIRNILWIVKELLNTKFKELDSDDLKNLVQLIDSLIEASFSCLNSNCCEECKELPIFLWKLIKHYYQQLKRFYQQLNKNPLPKARPQFILTLKRLEKVLSISGFSLEQFYKDFPEIKNQFTTSELRNVFAGIVVEEEKELYSIARESVFEISVKPIINCKEANFSAKGSCFIYKQVKKGEKYKTYFLTNLHVIHGIHQVIHFISENFDPSTNYSIKLFVSIDGKEQEIEEVFVPVEEIYQSVLLKEPGSEKFDFAVFTLLLDSRKRFFHIKRNSFIREGEKVYAFGYPQGLNLTMSDGIISHVYDFNCIENETSLRCAGTIQHNILINPGNSGGPTVKRNGEIVGISTFGLAAGIGLNFSIDIRFIVQWLNNRNFMRKFDVRNYIKERMEDLRINRIF